MKKLLSIVLSFFILLNAFPISAFANDVGDSIPADTVVVEAAGEIESLEVEEVEEIIAEESSGEDIDEELVDEDGGTNDLIEEQPEETSEEQLVGESEEASNGETQDIEPSGVGPITNSGQGGQVLDDNFSTGVDLGNTGFNSDFSSGSGQSGQVIEVTPTLEVFLEEGQKDGEIILPQIKSPMAIPELIISEVFFDGTSERIEIYNIGATEFSGDIIISGASASLKNINNLTIATSETKIFTDTNVDSILDISSVFQTDMGFSISDTQAMNIEIIYSGQSLDIFSVDSATVSSLANKVSLHKFIDTQNIVESNLVHTANTTTGYIANPGLVYTEIIPLTDPELKITEIYFDGDEERFEITNIHATQDFSGSLSLFGNLTLNISTQILLGESIVYANAIYPMFQTGANIQTISGIINFDTGAINLDLIRSGQTLDTFYAHETQVQYYDQADTSFEKVGSASTFRTTTVVGLASDRYYNVNWGIAANPTTYFTTGENLIDVTQAREPASYEEPLPINCDDFWDDSTANISEVYYGNSLYSPYVELRVQETIYDMYPYIKLEGTALSGIVAFATESSDFSNIDMERNKRILISNTESRYNEGRESVSDPNFALTTGGRLTLYGRDSWEESRQVLDIIYLAGPSVGNSLYVGGNTNECASIFDYQDKFSPGLTVGQSQFIDITPDPIIQYITVGGGGCSFNSSPNFNTNDDLSKEIQISAMKHFGDLQILKLKNKTDSDINLRDYKIQELDGSTQTIKGNTLFAKTTMSFVGNYGFPTNQDYCFNLVKIEGSSQRVVDRYCRNSMSKASETDEQNILNQLSFWVDTEDTDDDEVVVGSGSQTGDIIGNPLQTNTIKIMDIDYNPDGSDTNNETITLLLLSGTQIDLSIYTLQYVKDGKSTNKKIQGILSHGNEQIFKGNYTFPNSTKDKLSVVVNLINQDQYGNNYIVDTYVYNPNKITEIPNGEYQVISVIDGDTIKISYAGKEFNIRFAGIDAPESSTLRCGKVECFGPESKTYLKSLLENQTIRFESSIETQQDSFDRFVGYIFLNGDNINKKMIYDGYAREYSYKNQSYKYSSEFKSAQDHAQSNKLGLWASNGNGCNGQRLCPVEETAIDINYGFNIENIIYNPEGSDVGNEVIKISMQKGFTVDFADGFFLMINDTKRYLKKYGTISPGDTKTLQGSFSFPNTKKTTVSLSNGETTFDTYVYDPKIDELLDIDDTLTGGLQNTGTYQSSIGISIVSILPNPLGKDTLGEEIGLLYFGQKTEINPKINLSDGYYLKIGDKKTYLKNKINNNRYELVSDQEALLVGNFGLPNKSSCVEIGYENFIFDKFCYSEPEEGQKFFKTNGVLESINVIDFSILNGANLQNIGNQVCLMYGSQKFYCKNMPYSKLSIKKVNQNKLYKEFFDSFENYLKDQRKIMYYDTDIKNYFNLLNEIEKAISEGNSMFELDGVIFKTSEFQPMYEIKYPQTTSEFVQTKLSDFIPSPIRQKYNNLLEEYNQYLIQNN